MNKIFVTNTHIAPIVDVSTYDGPFSYEHLWQPDEESEREEGRIVCWDYDPEKMGERIVEEANRVFGRDKPLAKYGVVEIKATRFGSPREYNFMTDWLDLSVEVDDSFFGRARKAIVLDPENRKAVVKHCKDHWVSKDGFNSFMLNRVRDLSLNWWEHEHYGRRMSTDEEIEEAVMSDLQEVLVMLEEETSEDMFRDFGAVLALLWRFEYPADFDLNLDQLYGSWVTEEMVEHLRGNSSISEFCTVLDKDEAKARFGAHMIDFDRRRRELKVDLGKYLSADFQDRARIEKVCGLFREKVGKVFDDLEAEQARVIADHATGDRAKDDAVNERLDDFREEAALQMTVAAFTPLWAEASHEAM